jgi:hypothetical protein
VFFYIKDFIPKETLEVINFFIQSNENKFRLNTLDDKQPSIQIDKTIKNIFDDLSNSLNSKIAELLLVEVSKERLGTIVKYGPGMDLPLHVDHPLIDRS